MKFFQGQATHKLVRSFSSDDSHLKLDRILVYLNHEHFKFLRCFSHAGSV